MGCAMSDYTIAIHESAHAIVAASQILRDPRGYFIRGHDTVSAISITREGDSLGRVMAMGSGCDAKGCVLPRGRAGYMRCERLRQR
jgi:hypothetical protein